MVSEHWVMRLRWFYGGVLADLPTQAHPPWPLIPPPCMTESLIPSLSTSGWCVLSVLAPTGCRASPSGCYTLVGVSEVPPVTVKCL